jgi:hypothetical protein
MDNLSPAGTSYPEHTAENSNATVQNPPYKTKVVDKDEVLKKIYDDYNADKDTPLENRIVTLVNAKDKLAYEVLLKVLPKEGEEVKKYETVSDDILEQGYKVTFMSTEIGAYHFLRENNISLADYPTFPDLQKAVLDAKIINNTLELSDSELKN